MALNNVPQAGQTLAETRNPIRNNFNTINAAFLVDHVEYNVANQGFHKKITMPAQVPTPLFNGLNGLWSELYPVTAKPEIWVNTAEAIPANSQQYPITASILRVNPAPPSLNTIGGSGWSYLPSGLIMKWGTLDAGTISPVLFPVGANIPAFTQILSFQLTIGNTATGSTATITYFGVTNLQFNWFANNTNANSRFNYLAIGY